MAADDFLGTMVVVYNSITEDEETHVNAPVRWIEFKAGAVGDRAVLYSKAEDGTVSTDPFFDHEVNHSSGSVRETYDDWLPVFNLLIDYSESTLSDGFVLRIAYR